MFRDDIFLICDSKCLTMLNGEDFLISIVLTSVASLNSQASCDKKGVKDALSTRK
jgi:hypothetical protein